ncbi:MAG: HEAT repeat domain-containing protein [Myxococcales bacterium]
MKRILLSISAVLLLAAAPRVPSQQEVLAALQGYENPITRASMQGLGPGWDAVVAKVVADEQTPSATRQRALFALRFASGEEVARVLRENVLRNRDAVEGAPVLELIEALGALAKVQGEKATAVLVPMLSHPVPDVRVAAGEALAGIGTEAAREAVRQQLEREPESFVREALGAAL